MYIPTLLVLAVLQQIISASPVPQLLIASPTDSLTTFDDAAPKCYSTCAISVEETCTTPSMCDCDNFLLGIKDCLEASCPNDRKSEEWRQAKIGVCEKEEEKAQKSTAAKTTFTASGTLTVPTTSGTATSTTTATITPTSAASSETSKTSSKIPTSYIVGIAVSATLGLAVLIVIIVVLYRSCRGKSLTPHPFRKIKPQDPHLEETKKYFSSPPPLLPQPRFVSPLTVPIPAYTTPPLPPVSTAPRPGTSNSTSSNSVFNLFPHAPPSTPALVANIFAKLTPTPAELPATPPPAEIKGPNPYNAYLRQNNNPFRRTGNAIRESLRRSLITKSWVSETPSNFRASTAVNIGFLDAAERLESFSTMATKGTSTQPPSSTPSTPSLAAFPIPPGAAAEKVPAVPKIPASVGPKLDMKRAAPKPKSWVYTSDDELTDSSSDGDETSLCFSDDDRTRQASKGLGKSIGKRKSIRSIGKVGSGRGLVVVPAEKRVSTRPWEDRFWICKVEEEEIARSPVDGKGKPFDKGKSKAVEGGEKKRAESPLGKGRPLTPEGVDESELEEMEKLVGEMGRI